MTSVTDNESFQDMAAHPRLPDNLTSEISRLYSSGHSLIPLGKDDGKSAIVEFRDRARLPLSVVVDRMVAAGSHSYGIRLAGLMVVDVDTDTPEARDYVERRFGNSSVSTQTSRGFHLYFRHDGPKPPPVRQPGIVIDFKSGQNEYVVGALSQRPDGFVYLADGRLTAPAQLPPFLDLAANSNSRASASVRGRYPEGERHTRLKKRALELVRVAESFDEFLENLLAFRTLELEQPEDFSDSRVTGMAYWYWEKRESGKLWGGANSAVKLRRSEINEFARLGAGLAFLLHGILQADHGHKPNAAFAIVPEGLRKSGRLKAGERQIYAAIKILLKLDLLRRMKRSRGKGDPSLYQLGRGSNLILVSGKDTQDEDFKEQRETEQARTLGRSWRPAAVGGDPGLVDRVCRQGDGTHP